jgi:hypothetical protein
MEQIQSITNQENHFENLFEESQKITENEDEAFYQMLYQNENLRQEVCNSILYDDTTTQHQMMQELYSF